MGYELESVHLSQRLFNNPLAQVFRHRTPFRAPSSAAKHHQT